MLTCFVDRNGKQSGEVVDSHTIKLPAASAAEAPTAESDLTIKRGPKRVLKESNAAEIKVASATVDKEPARKITRQRKPTSVKARTSDVGQGTEIYTPALKT